MLRSARPSSHVLVAAAWAGAVLATQAWPSWSTGIREQFAGDVVSYEQIARAAPGLPAGPLPQQHAERFPIHWAIGTVSDLTETELHGVYRTVSVGLLLAIVAALALTLRRLGLDLRTRVVLTGLVVASAYPVRYLLAAPGMAADALFLLGLVIALWALLADEDGALVGGLLVAALGRQTAVPLAIAAALVMLARRRYRAAAATALLPALLFVVLRVVAERFSNGGVLGGSSSVGSALGHPHELASHLGRMALVLAVPAAVAGGAWIRTRVMPAAAPLALAAAVVVQPLVLNPELVAKNEPRLTGLALPALAVALAPPLRAAMLGAAETAVLSAAILLSSFHARYSDVGLAHSWQWAVLVAACAAAVFVTLARVQAKSRVPSGASQVAGTPWRT